MDAIQLKEVQKTYRTGHLTVPVIHGASLEIKSGEMVAIMGPSGSGKSTLMNLIGLLDRPTQGEVFLDGKKLDLSMSDNALAHVRSEKVGFVFQSFQLLPRLTALANVLLPSTYRKAGRGDRTERAKQLLTRFGLADRMHHLPSELSGGEKQRVAIARALMNDPDIILADEPTGNLDSKAGQEVMKVLQELHEQGKTVVIITHDVGIAKGCERVIHILDGKVQGGTHA